MFFYYYAQENKQCVNLFSYTYIPRAERSCPIISPAVVRCWNHVVTEINKASFTCFKFRRPFKYCEYCEVEALYYSILGVPSGKCQRGEFVYLLWNVPIQIFAIYLFFFIISEVHNGFRYRKGWHPTSKQQLWHTLGFHFY